MSISRAWKSSRSWVSGYPMIVRLSLPHSKITTSSSSHMCSRATSSNCRNFQYSSVLTHKVDLMANSKIQRSWITVQPSSSMKNAVQRLNVDGFWDFQNLRYSLISIGKNRGKMVIVSSFKNTGMGGLAYSN